MIIVSQDKRSIINFEKINVININRLDSREIDAYFNCDEEKTLDNIMLGKYETEKRAEEVLKEITEAYSNWQNFLAGQPQGVCTPKYEMPLE